MSLKELRCESGLKAYKIAEQLGISYRQYNRIEKGEVRLSKLKTEKLSQIFQIGVTEISKAWGESKCKNY